MSQSGGSSGTNGTSTGIPQPSTSSSSYSSYTSYFWNPISNNNNNSNDKQQQILVSASMATPVTPAYVASATTVFVSKNSNVNTSAPAPVQSNNSTTTNHTQQQPTSWYSSLLPIMNFNQQPIQTTAAPAVATNSTPFYSFLPFIPNFGYGNNTATATSTATSSSSTLTLKNKQPQPNPSPPKSKPADPTASILTPICPCPPGWEDDVDEAFQACTSYKKIPVGEYSEEFNVLTSFIGSAAAEYIEISRIERIVNESLWSQFKNTRKELVSKKSDNWALLHEFGLTEKEVHKRAHVAMNFDKDEGIPEYMDNMALLFHCTRGNVESVLVQGLDERLGAGGLVGKGIYFSDDPLKSLSYDTHGVLMIFAVLLGDCISLADLHSRGSLVREPEKTQCQMRNHGDLFFDSVVWRPNNQSASEYVIYNRSHCCPIYVVSYKNKKGGGYAVPVGLTASGTVGDIYSEARKKFPPFAWVGGKAGGGVQNIKKPPRGKGKAKTKTAAEALADIAPGISASTPESWPFFAKTIFELMNEGVTMDVTDPTAHADSIIDLGDDDDAGEADADLVMKVSTITDLGIPGYLDYKDVEPLLRRFGLNVENTIDYILQNPIETQRASGQNSQVQSQGPASPLGNGVNGIHPSFVSKYRNGGRMQVGNQSQPFVGPTLTTTAPNLMSSLTVTIPTSTSTSTTSKRKQSPPPPQLSPGTAAKIRMQKLDDSITRVIQGLGSSSSSSSKSTVTSATATATASTSKSKPKGVATKVKVNTNAKTKFATATTATTATVPAPAVTLSANGSMKKLKLDHNATGASGNDGGANGDTNASATTANSNDSNMETGMDEECKICYVDYPPGPQHWKTLACSHNLCHQCYGSLETKRKTMITKKEHTFVKCPFCQACSGGLEIGDCPDGTMLVANQTYDCEGYEGHGTIRISYNVIGKYKLNRIGYLPNNAEGKKMLGLLRTAWDRRLCFTIGQSITTGAQDTLVWNIHHKTNVRGGIQEHGYPDPTYMDRLKDELRQYGLE